MRKRFNIVWTRVMSSLMAVMMAVAILCGSTGSAAEKLGGLELGGTLGGYTIVDTSVNKLPQQAASAIASVNSELLGATYDPIWYMGYQLVNGTNHLFIAKDIRATKNKDTSIVGLVVNVPPGDGYLNAEGAKVVRIIESEPLSPEVQAAYTKVMNNLIGVDYKPVLYVGKQIAHGVNHYIVCQALCVYPGAQPYAAVVCVNIAEGNASLVSIMPINPHAGTKDAKGLFGYSFTW